MFEVAIVAGIVTIIFIEVQLQRRHTTVRRPQRSRKMARLSKPSDAPGNVISEPYAACTSSTMPLLFGITVPQPDGTEVALPQITLATPDTHGNDELSSQMARSGVKSKKGTSLVLPPRGLSRPARKRSPSPHLMHERPSYVQRLSQTAALPRAQSESQGLKSDVRMEEHVDSRTAEHSVNGAEINTGQKGIELLDDSDDVFSPSSLPDTTGLESPEHTKRGRPSARQTSTRKDTSVESDSWRRRGRSPGPRPNLEALGTESEDLIKNESLSERVTENERQDEKPDFAGWIPATDLASEK